MKIPIQNLLKIDNIETYEISFNRMDPLFTAIFVISGKMNNAVDSYTVTKKKLEELPSKGEANISVITNKKFKEILKEASPSSLQNLSGETGINELFNLAREYEVMNLKSQKRRYITVLDDICSYEKQQVFGGPQLLIEYGTRLSLNIINKVEKKINPIEKAEYKDSEEGVLTFIPDAKDFKLKVDLFAILAGLNVEIYDANTPEEAIELYKTKSPKLVILGNLNRIFTAKAVLLELEKYDPFVKKMIYNESPASNRQSETQKIKNTYYSGYSELINLINRKKLALPPDIRNNIMSGLEKLKTNYSYQNFVETGYTINQFGRFYNISSLLNMLENIKSGHSPKQ